MRQSLRYMYLLWVTIIIMSCEQENYHYPQDRKVANNRGILKDSLGFYFSTFEPFDSSQHEFVSDTFHQQYISANLFAFDEPVLFNDYLGKEQYRFLWLRTFHLPIVFTISNDGGIVTLTTKKLDRQPLFRGIRYAGMPDRDSHYISQGYHLFREIDTLENGKTEVVTVIKPDRKANLIHKLTRRLTKEDWQKFEKLLDEGKFWELKPYQWKGYKDGSMWVIEAHKQAGYRYLIRQSPEGHVRRVGEMLITLSGLKEEIY